MKQLFQVLLDTLFPPKCPACGSLEGMRPVGRSETGTFSGSAGTGFCRRCAAELPAVRSPLCSKCGIPFSSKEGPDHYCAVCLTETLHFRKARAFGVYCGVLMKAVHALKYGKNAGVSRPLGALMGDCFLRHWKPEEIDLVVAVPLHIKRLRERGFNQAHLLIMPWAKKRDIAVDASVVARCRPTEAQTGLTVGARKGNVKGAFEVKEPERVRGKRVLLVDDVYTTGSTLNECAKVLLKAQTEYVDVLTLARAL